MRLKDKIAVVTGGGSGFGEGIAHTFAREGAKVVVADIDQTAAARVADAIGAAGGQAIAAQTDVSKDADVARLLRETLAAFANAHIVVNNAAPRIATGRCSKSTKPSSTASMRST